MCYNALYRRELFIKKYIITLLLILGLTMSLSVYGASAANTSSNTTASTINQVSTASNTSHTTTKTSTSKAVSTTNTKTIKVLIYSGVGAINSCVSGVYNGLHSANTQHLVPGYVFSVKTTKTISSSTLSGFDVLVMPGGTSGITYIKYVDGNAIKKFVASGHGYLGICAGAYSGSKYVEGMYSGWGLAPHVYCKHVTHEGTLLVKTGSAVSGLLGSSQTIKLAHYNGPAMYTSGGNVVTFATYADSSTGYNGYKAIVGDYYGNGRTILSGPHPELQPTNLKLLSKLVLWLDKVDSLSTSIGVTSTTPSNKAVNVAANKVIAVNFNKAIQYGNKNIILKSSTGTVIPIKTSISGSTLTISHSLLSKGTKYILTLGSGSIMDMSGKSIGSYSMSFTVSSLTTTEMKNGISRVKAFIAKNNRLPTYVSFGTMQISIANFKEIISAYGLKI